MTSVVPRVARRFGLRTRQACSRRLGALSAALLLICALPGSAIAAGQFTLDRGAASNGPVVIDQSGNGYVAWQHVTSSGSDVDMFCKFPPGAHKCSDPITLPVSLYETAGNTDTPYPVLGPGDDVFVVAPSYDTDQMVMWESTDGGLTFGAPAVGPTSADFANPNVTDTCVVGLDLDDVLPINAYGSQYDRSQGLSTLGSGASVLEFDLASDDPFATFSFGFYGNSCVAPSTVTVTPGKIPAQWFNFGGDGLGDAGVGSDQSTLGWAGGGSAACALVAPGDEVEAYSTGSTPGYVRFFYWSAPTGPCGADPGVNLSTGGEDNWSGPSTVTQGALPRLAGGKAGLFLLSGDAVHLGASQPTAVDVRHYESSSHSFGSPQRLAVVHDEDFATGGPGGGLGENYSTGEVAAVWPGVSGGQPDAMNLYISTDGGVHFSAAQDIATKSFAYAGFGNARVAVAADGNGFVTWEDSGGLHVADFTPLAAAYRRLVAHHSKVVELPVTCEAPKGRCKASVTVTAKKSTTIATGHRSVLSGRTELLRLALNASGQALLKAASGGRLKATVKLTIKRPPAKPERIVTHTLIVR